MPKTITTGQTVTLTDIDQPQATFAYEDGEFVMIVKYRVLRDDGTVHEVKSVGQYPGFQGVKTAVKAMLDGPALKADIMAREGL